MKKIFIILIALITFASCNKEVSEIIDEKALNEKVFQLNDLAKRPRGSAALRIDSTLTGTLNPNNTISLSWSLSRPDVKWLAVVRKYTDGNGVVYTSQGSDLTVVNGGSQLYPSYNNWLVTDTRPLSWVNVLAGDYDFYIGGSYYDDTPFVTNHVVVNVP